MRHTASRLAILICLLWAVPASAATCDANDTAALVSCIDSVDRGDTITLTPGATYVTSSTFTLPVKVSGTGYVTITVEGGCAFDRRVAGEADLPSMATLSSDTASVLVVNAAAGSGWYKFDCIAFTQTGGDTFDLIRLGTLESSQDTLAEVPGPFILDRWYAYVEDAVFQTRAIALHSSTTDITRGRCENIRTSNGESQCIGAVNGPGPYLIDDNYLEAANINLLFGGAEVHVPDLIPSDITITNNTITKPAEWVSENFSAKNLFEIKCAQNVTFRGNTLDNSWVQGQVGQGILLTVRGWADPGAWCTIANVTIERNIIRNVCQAFQITGITDGEGGDVTLEAHDLIIQDNLIVVNPVSAGACSGSNLYAFGISHNPDGLIIRRNTIILLTDHTMVGAYPLGLSSAVGATPTGFVFSDNVVQHGDYFAFFGGMLAEDALDAYFGTYTVTGNCLGGHIDEGWTDANHLPTGQITVDTYADFEALFTDYGGGTYTLLPSGVCDGKGVDFSLLPGGEEAPVLRYRLRLRGMG